MSLHIVNPEQYIVSRMAEHGLAVNNIVIDGKIHRFATQEDVGAKKSGWYIFFDGYYVCGAFGDFRKNIDETLSCVTRELNFEEIKFQKEKIEEIKILRAAERLALSFETSCKAKNIIDNSPICATHQYLENKKVKSYGLKIATDGRLIVPIIDVDNKIISCQFIDGEGNKKYLYGTDVRGHFCKIEGSEYIYICEGYATASTIHELTGGTVYAALQANNLPNVAQAIKTKLQYNDIAIVADNDPDGIKYAEIASDLINARIIMSPVEGMDINDYQNSGNNAKILFIDKPDNWLIDVFNFCKKPEPTKWLIKHWIPEQSIIMLHGASGSKKTFVALDMALRVASDYQLWHNYKVFGGDVIYIAGEGHHGLKKRIAAWVQEFKPKNKVKLYISRTGASVDDRLELSAIISNINKLEIKPKLIIIDTLHRCMIGDENKSIDVAKMIKSIDELRNVYDCSVLIVHHTGVSDEAQTRARGSSAWRGAIDVEINIKSIDNVTEVKQLKMKDDELAEVKKLTYKKINLDGWLDCDNNQMTSLVMVDASATEFNFDDNIEFFRLNYTGINSAGKYYITFNDIFKKLPNTRSVTKFIDENKQLNIIREDHGTKNIFIINEKFSKIFL